jgi:hypothetical protein
MGGGGADPHAGLGMGGGGADPHAGLGMGGGGADPHAGLDMGGGGADPHAGLDLGGGGADPHAGLAMGGGGPGAEAPPVDPGKFLRGSIVATAETSPLVKPGAILFLSVKPVEPLSGDVIGGTIAVDRIDVDHLPISFELTGANRMRLDTGFDGDVVISARIDQDGEARSSQPGDVEGSVRAKIPAAGITLTLDRVVR